MQDIITDELLGKALAMTNFAWTRTTWNVIFKVKISWFHYARNPQDFLYVVYFWPFLYVIITYDKDDW